MLDAVLYAADCDTCKARFGTDPNQFRLRRDAEAAGWKFRRRKDGQVALSGGKDYCPFCVPATWNGVR